MTIIKHFLQLTSVEVMTAFIERIKEVNPLLNCVVDNRFTEALKDAERADKLIESDTLTVEQLANEKPFLGVPISTKDCLRVKGKDYFFRKVSNTGKMPV